MKNSASDLGQILSTAIALSIAAAVSAPPAEAAALIQTDLFFGRNIAGGGEVSEEEFAAFVDGVITPRFPAGLTIFDADGQFQDSTGALVQEPSKLVTLFRDGTPASEAAVREIVAAYIQEFSQESVLQITNQDELKVGFGVGENLIDNDPTPELIQADLLFGRNIPSGGEVTEAQFQAFVDGVITPRFPAGLTVFDADGQFQDSTGTIIEEQAKGVTLLFEDTEANEAAIDQIIAAYTEQFNQESVLLAVNEAIAVGFGVGENLIDNDPTPELIQTDLFFGRNIPGGGEVSEAQFQAFVDGVITPRFPAGLTVFDADGQFLDSTGSLIAEQSKGVTLLFEDTEANERAIDEIITEYTTQFNQESVLLVVDEAIEVAFDASPTTVPEPAAGMGLLAFGAGLLLVRKSKASLPAIQHLEEISR